MSAGENGLETQIGLCTILGPYIMLITLTVLSIAPGQRSLLIPLISLAAIPACWFWKLRGFCGAVICLLLAFVYRFFNAPPEMIFRDLMLTASAGLTYGITAFCSMETAELFELKGKEFTERLQELLLSNEKMQLLDEQKATEINFANAQAGRLQQELQERTDSLHSSELSLAAAQKKIDTITTQNDQLLRELFQKRHECDKFTKQMEVSLLEIQELKNEIALLSLVPANPVPEVAEVSVEEVGNVGAPSPQRAPKSQPTGKAKSSKTNTWANAIMSRWSDS